LAADFDFLVGAEARTAVAGVARWRRCQLVIVKRQDCASWWRWLRGSRTDWIMSLMGSFSFLSLPGTDTLGTTVPPSARSPVPRESSLPSGPTTHKAPGMVGLPR
jgi:hypothetical protein